jgi:hypothetical protein
MFLRLTIAMLAAFALGPLYVRSAGPDQRVKFTDNAARAGITAPNVFGGVTGKRYILEMNGTGVAFTDYDRDGYVDLFLVNGRPLVETGGPPPTSHLYRNNADGSFTDVTQRAGLALSGWGQGACTADYDNDGFDDLFVTYYGKNKLYHNDGHGRFEDVAERAGVGGPEGRWNSGCAFLDYNRDGKIDLFVTNYVDLGLDLANLPAPGSGQYCQYKGIPIACGPRGLKKAANYLYRNNGNGTFSDVSEASGIRNTEGHYSLGVLALDYDKDGFPDLYVACDSAPSMLFHNNRDGTFTDVGVSAGTAYSDDGEAQAGMGVAAADFDHDGSLDILKTNFSDDSPNLFHNNGDGTFSDVVFQAGLGRLRSFLGWGVVFADFDNDGWSDVLIANGHLAPEVDLAGSDSPYRQRKLFYRNLGNSRFEDLSLTAGADLARLHSSRGAAAADISNDGRLAVAVSEMNDVPSLLLAEPAASNHWIGIRTIGTKSNRSGVGARVELQAGALKLVDEIRSGGSYISQNDLRAHFGLGMNARVDRLTVYWPSGATDRWENIAADQQIIVEEGARNWRGAPGPKARR